MVTEGKGNLFRRKDGKYLIYLPLDLADDSMFPFRDLRRLRGAIESQHVKVSFQVGGKKELVVEPWE